MPAQGPPVPFRGFPPEGLRFLKSLGRNNRREWFEARRETYLETLLEPSRAFVVELGERLQEFAPRTVAVPKVGGSLFRIHRDIRFSADKTPYRKEIAFMFWDRSLPRFQSSAFYLHFSPTELVLGAGMYFFQKDQLRRFREAVDREGSGKRLERLCQKAGKAHIAVGGEALKRVPSGWDREHPRRDLLRHRGLYFSLTGKLPAVLHRPSFVEYCAERFRRMLPIHQWLLEEVGAQTSGSASR